MFERIIEIILFVMTELQDKEQLTDVDVEKLHNLGYTNSEISTAFSWLLDKVEVNEKLLDRQERTLGSFRKLHEAEEELFTKEARGEIIQLQTLGLLSNEQLEILIEKTLMSGGLSINKDMLRRYLAGIMFHDDSVSQFGSRIMLNGSDTIN
jgi:uncharacterized protein Smg (DUF494 family)